MVKIIKIEKNDVMCYDFIMISRDFHEPIMCIFNIKYSKLRNKKQIQEFVNSCDSLDKFRQYLYRQDLIIVPLKNYMNKYATFEIVPKKTYKSILNAKENQKINENNDNFDDLN